MAQAPAMPLFTDALLGDTTHLSLEEFGAYVKLLIIDWRSKPAHISDDDPRIARMLGISVRRWRAMKPTLCDGKLYRIVGRKFRQKRLDREWAWVQKKIETNRANALRGNVTKSLKKTKTGSANATAKTERTRQPNGAVRTTERERTYTYKESKKSPLPATVSPEPRAASLSDEVVVEVMDLLEAADPAWATRSGAIVRTWIAEGADPGEHILPVIRQAIERGQAGTIGTLNYFTPAIRRRIAERPVVSRRPAEQAPRHRALIMAQDRGDDAFELQISMALRDHGAEAADRLGADYLERQHVTAPEA